MPYVVQAKDNQFCVFKRDANGQPTGDALGCHASRDKAQQQMAALYANEPGARETVILEAQLKGKADGTEGREWAVTILGPEGPDDLISVGGREYVRSKNGRAYAIDGLRAAAPMFADAMVYDNHLTDAEFRERQGMRSPGREWIGTILNPRFSEETHSLDGTLRIVDEALARKLKAAWDGQAMGTVGLSIDTDPIWAEREIEYRGMYMPVIEGFKEVLSVDLVARPAAGGRFNRLIAANVANEAKETKAMKWTMEQVKELLADEAVADMVRKLLAVEPAEKPAVPDEEDKPKPEAAVEGAAAEEPKVEAATEELKAEDKPAEEPAPAVTAEEAVRRLECQFTLHTRLDAAKLPVEYRQAIEAQFAGRMFPVRDLDRMIADMKTLQAKGDKSGQPPAAGSTREAVIRVGLGPQDKAEIEFMRLVMGQTAFRALEQNSDTLVKERLPEAYTSWLKTDRGRWGYTSMRELIYDYLGDPLSGDGPRRATEAVTTSNMTSIIKNTVNLMIAADYSVRERWWEPIVRTEEVDTIDDATLVRVYGMDLLPVVSEGAPYTEASWVDEEETASFVKRGDFIAVTMETLLRDKLNVIRSIPSRLSNAWYNTISSLVSGVFTVNTAAGPVLADTGALFNATAATTVGGHANLLTTALSYSQLATVETAMMKQTDQYLGVGRRLGIRPRFVLVPFDLLNTAETIRDTKEIPNSANNDINKFYQRIDVIGVPDWTDATNWACVADPAQYPAIWLIFYRGRRVPEIYTAGDETSGTMFTNDTMRYKVRMLTFRYSSTYDCAPVSDFRPLHKSNVAG